MISTSPTDGPARPKKTGGRWFKVRVVLAALVLLIGLTLYFNWRNGLSPRVVQEIGTGHAYLDVAIMTIYTPSLAVPGFATGVNVSFVATTSYATRLTFTWGSVNGTSMRVRFVLTPSPLDDSNGPSFAPGPSNGFLFLPAGQPLGGVVSSMLVFGVVKPGADGVWSETWRMDYAVRKMSAHDWCSEDQWIEVDYSLTPTFVMFGYLPAANTTAPHPSDLAPLGSPLVVSYAAGYPWSYRWTIRDFSLPAGGFRHTVGTVDLDAGTVGTIRATIGSTFQWGPNDGYEIHASGSGPANLSLQMYVDIRFGSLRVESTA